MKNTNSSLATVFIPSQFRTKHTSRVIDTITIHCMAGDLSVETCGQLFQREKRNASSNYGIGTDGRIALYVDEKDDSWCSSSTANDSRAITIEVANDGDASTQWHISKRAYDSLVKLLIDICKRNEIPQLRWLNDKTLIGQVELQNITVHRWFKNKDCPGGYIMKSLPDIVTRVNKELTTDKYLYRVQVGAFIKKENAQSLVKELKRHGFSGIIKKEVVKR